jgi:hypothetical protein
MSVLRKNIALSLISLILCHFIAHGFSLAQTDVTCLTSESTTQIIDVDTIRGGSIDDTIRPQSRKIILDFLASNKSNGEFHIQGWRWHFMSLIRDCNRLERLADYLSHHVDDDLGFEALEQAADYVINFNMAGLHRVEEKMFVGWLRNNLCNTGIVGEFSEDGQMVSDAFREVIDKVDEQRVQSSKLGKELVSDGYVYCTVLFICLVLTLLHPILFSTTKLKQLQPKQNLDIRDNNI